MWSRMFLAIVITGALTTACSSGPSSGNKAGGSGEAVVLRMANGYGGIDYEPAVAYFVQRVAELSKDQLRIDVTDNWGNFGPDFEQRVVRDTASAVVDLGWSGSRVFDTLGVRSFQALTAPMLIDNYALQNAVIDSELPTEMSKNLGQLGVTTLGVLASSFRKPIGVQHPLLGLADYKGLTFWSTRSDAQRQAILALGARPADEIGPGANRDTAIDRGEIQGFEMSPLLYKLNLQSNRAPFITANVNLWPQPVVIFANTPRLNRLARQQRDWLYQAARDTVAESKNIANRDTEYLTEACTQGARISNAATDDITALRQALAPVTESLAQDPQTKTFITRIEELKTSTTPDIIPRIPANCETVKSTSTPTRSPFPPSSLNGTYRWTLSQQDAIDHGTPSDKTPAALRTFPQTFSVSLADGQWFMSEFRATETGSGTYTINGSQLAFDWPQKRYTITFTHTVNGVGNINLQPVEPMDPGDRFVWTTKPWTKIN